MQVKIIFRLFIQNSLICVHDCILFVVSQLVKFPIIGRQNLLRWWLWAESKIFFDLRFGELLAIISSDYY